MFRVFYFTKMEESHYSKLLRHPYWQRKRLEIFNRDEWKCRRCADPFTNLQVHHLYYRYGWKPWEYPNDALITLCSLCHEKAEFEKWFLVTGVTSMVKMQLQPFDIEQVKEVVLRRLAANRHKESARIYMRDIKILLRG